MTATAHPGQALHPVTASSIGLGCLVQSRVGTLPQACCPQVGFVMERRSGEWDLRSEKCELVDTERMGALWKGRQWGDALRDAVRGVQG